ncbi:phosphoglycolate phosphatase [Hydrogenimonas cancrithermarum]|nr:phosphoglycolate phosphatase [Hydrogenimonas cancrithermarum]
MRKKELIIFDLDGTLIDSAPDLADAVNRTLETLGHAPFDETTIRGWVGNGARTLVKRALSGSTAIDEKLDDALFEEALEIFLGRYAQNLCRRTRLYPGVRETLERLHTRGHRLAIATNKPHVFVSPILETLALETFFDAILGGDSLPKKKPDPMPLLHLCGLLDVPPAHTLMVGDSKNDILAAKAAGIEVVGVTYGYNYGEDIALHAPDAVAERFEEILGYLEKGGNDGA